MKTVFKLFVCIVVLLVIPAALLADSNRGYKVHEYGWSATGRVVLASPDEEILDLYDNSRNYHTVIARDAKIYDGNREIGFRTIRKDDLIQVYGQERRDGAIEAHSIYKLDDGQNSHMSPAERVILYGSVKEIGRDRDWLELRVGHETQRVRTPHTAKVYAVRDNGIGAGNLHEGDQVRIEGYNCGGDEIMASMIFVGTGTDRSIRNITARVTGEASMFNRRLQVIVVDHNHGLPDVFDINVPKDTDITSDGRGISVHNIHTGDFLHVEGMWNGSSFVPVRIVVDKSNGTERSDFDHNYQAMRGTVRKIDCDLRQLDLSSPSGNMIVYADRARVWDGPNIVKFADLRRGEQVFVRGNVDNGQVDAERIDIIRHDR